MKNKKIFKYIGNSLLVVLLFTIVTILNISVQNNTTSSDKTKQKTSQQTKLNVAIVNEDQAVRVDKKEYNLGASYVKNIERDNSQNWFVVTRGAADAGLEKGTYQLVLTIPSDFSEKVLDVNSINADKTTVTYKVNAAGNLQVENEANKLAKDIVADLNSQLVDMYMASILSNLYTAQKNVQASSQVQATNIGKYKTNLLDTAINSKNIFPTLYSMTNSSVDANNMLKSNLENFTQSFDTLGTSQTAYDNNFSSLLKQRGEDQISYAAFMDQLMSMSRDSLSSETKKLYDDLQKQQETLGKQIGSSEGKDAADAKTYTGLATSVSQKIEDLEKDLKAERDKFKEHQDNIKDFITKMEWLDVTVTWSEKRKYIIFEPFGGRKYRNNRFFPPSSFTKEAFLEVFAFNQKMKKLIADHQVASYEELKALATAGSLPDLRLEEKTSRVYLKMEILEEKLAGEKDKRMPDTPKEVQKVVRESYFDEEAINRFLADETRQDILLPGKAEILKEDKKSFLLLESAEGYLFSASSLSKKFTKENLE